jgi:hydroxymethylbilane synthase
MVARQLEALHSGLSVELVHVKTTGDRVQDRPLQDIGGKGLFTKELEQALVAGDVDFAVHSLKDVPVTEPLVDVSSLVIAAVPEREDVRDALVLSPQLANEGVRRLADLAEGVRVGTSSLRRGCQVKRLRPEAHILPLRGNIDTRLKKVRAGEYDAILLAMAGLKRGGFGEGEDILAVGYEEMLPAAGQGALGLQCRARDQTTRGLISVLDDKATHAAVEQEREIVRLLGGDCHSPIAAFFDGVGLWARVFGRDGAEWAEARGATAVEVHENLGRRGDLARLGYAG